MSILKIACVQQDIVFGNKDENLITTAHSLNRVARDTDLVVIPELFSTGFITDPDQMKALSETNDGHTMDDVIRWAQYFGTAICGTFLATDGSRYFNRAFFVEPSGDKYFYDKRHLFSISGEHKAYTAGTTQSPLIRYRGWNIKMFVCYDLRFPVWCRKRKNEFDIMLFPSNWAHSRIFQYRQLLSARAIENNSIVVGCNRVGTDEYGDYPPGDSGIFNIRGHDVGQTDPSSGVIYATFDHDEFVTKRARFATWMDADDFNIVL